MKVLRNMCVFVLLTIVYVSSIVLAFAGLKVGLEDTTLVAWQPLVVHAEITWSLGDVDYDRYIDGAPLEGISTPWLDLSWQVYVELFPEDQDADAKRIVTLEATDAFGTSSDSAVLSIVHEPLSVCGDGEINQTLAEECDDGNTYNWDGCSETCQCEGMCTSLLMTRI